MPAQEGILKFDLEDYYARSAHLRATRADDAFLCIGELSKLIRDWRDEDKISDTECDKAFHIINDSYDVSPWVYGPE